MKWFKHITTSLDDPFVFEIVDRFGGDGYLVFFGTLETMSREFDIETPGICQISFSFLRKKLQLSAKKVTKILDFCEKKERIYYALEGDKMTLRCPKLKDLCDEWTKKQLRSKSVPAPPQELEVDLEEEEEDKKKTFEPDSDEIRLTEFFLKEIRQNNPDHKQPNLQNWAKSFDSIIRIDGKTPKDIAELIRWCQNDDFEMANVLSPDKLRKRYDALIMKKSKDNDGGGSKSDMQKFMERSRG